MPSHIETWNRHRLSQHKTSHLLRYTEYDTMQENLEKTVIKINKFIHTINSSNSVATPRLSKHIIYHRNSTIRTRYGKLVDGVHATDKLNSELVETLEHAINKNDHI